MNKTEQVNYLLESIENLIDAKANIADGGPNPVYQARADIREALAILLDVEIN